MFLSAATQLRSLQLPCDVSTTVSSASLPSLVALVLRKPDPFVAQPLRHTLQVVRNLMGSAPRLSWIYLDLPSLSSDDVADLVTLALDLERRCISFRVATPSYKILLSATKSLPVLAWDAEYT